MIKKINILVGFFLLVSISLLMLIVSQFAQSGSYTGPVEEIKLGVSKAAPELSALIYIAENQNYFSDQKLNVEQIDQENGIVAQQNAEKGVIDMATTIDFAFASDSFTHESMRILATIGRAKFVEIIVRNDRGITIPTDLKGKKIGVVPKSASEFSMGKFLAFNNILLSEITVVPLTFSELQDAIVSGKVDAVATNDPFAYNIKKALGVKSIYWPTQETPGVYWMVVTSQDYITRHAHTTQRFLAALVQAEQFLKKNPFEAKEIVRLKLNLDKDYFEQTWSKSNFSVTLDQSLLLTLEEEARWRIAHSFTDKITIPNYIDYIYADALRKIRVDSVTVY